MLPTQDHWSDIVVARVLSSYATSLLDVADMIRPRFPKQADDILALGAKLEIVAREVRAGWGAQP